MTLEQIKAELRRSAEEDVDPWFGLDQEAFHVALSYCQISENPAMYKYTPNLRTFYLLVAEAL